MPTGFEFLPDHQSIRPEEIEPAVSHMLQENQRKLEIILEATSDQVNWENFADAVEELGVRLTNLWAPISQMNSVASKEELRQAHDSCLERLAVYETSLLQSKPLYERYLALSDRKVFENLDFTQQRIVTEKLKAFARNGVSLSKKDRSRFKDLSSELSQLASKFNNNALDATDAWSKHVLDETLVAGLPQANLEVARGLARDQGVEGLVLTLDMPCYSNVMTHCTNRTLREEMYEAYVSRASEIGPNAREFDNSTVIGEVISKRHELAHLVGFESYAAFSIDEKMVGSAKETREFLEDLLARALPQAKQELTAMQKFALKEYGLESLEPWDGPFISERLKESLYSVSDEELRPYFPIDKVIDGMFEVVAHLYDISINRINSRSTWHEDVSMYEILENERPIAMFYLDPYARAKKRSGAWMADCRNRRDVGNQTQLPVAYLTCNFTPPFDGKPSLLTHNEVLTLFHEFGHGLHHMLTKQKYASVSGINGVEWDAVELPSQFMENWCWQSESIAKISGHHETGERLPQELMDRLLAAKNFNSATKMVRQLEFGLFDLTMHMVHPTEADPRKTWEQIKNRTNLLPTKEYDRFPWTFGHIFGGGYAAGYYSYLWAEVLSADAFAAFEEEGLDNRATGKRFLSCILEAGGSRPAAQLFKSFRGREPTMDALLRHSGIRG